MDQDKDSEIKENNTVIFMKLRSDSSSSSLSSSSFEIVEELSDTDSDSVCELDFIQNPSTSR